MSQLYANPQLFSYTHSEANTVKASQLQRADFIILNQVAHVSPFLRHALQNHLATGRRALFIPAPVPDIASYEALSTAIRTLDSNPLAYVLDAIDHAHPFFSQMFREKPARTQMPKVRPLLTLEVPDAEVILRLENKKPYYVATSSGDGTLYVLASPLENGYTDLARHTLAVPIFYKSALRGEAMDRMYCTMDNPVLSLPYRATTSPFVLQADQATPMVPFQYRMGDRLHLYLGDLQLAPGTYALSPSDAEKDEQAHWVAINYAREESLLSPIDTAEIKQHFSRVKDFHLLPVETTRPSGVSPPLWADGWSLRKLFLAFSLLLLLSELAVLRYMPS